MSVGNGLDTCVTFTHQTRICVEFRLGNPRELRHRKTRVSESDVLLRLIPAVVKRPRRHLELRESDLHPDTVVRDIGGHLTSRRDQLVRRFFPVTYVDPENHVGVLQ